MLVETTLCSNAMAKQVTISNGQSSYDPPTESNTLYYSILH